MVERCYTCANWRGNKEKVARQIAAYPQCMNLRQGWTETGGCVVYYRWLYLVINGDATVDVEVPANFGCPYWVAEEVTTCTKQ